MGLSDRACRVIEPEKENEKADYNKIDYLFSSSLSNHRVLGDYLPRSAGLHVYIRPAGSGGGAPAPKATASRAVNDIEGLSVSGRGSLAIEERTWNVTGDAADFLTPATWTSSRSSTSSELFGGPAGSHLLPSCAA